MKSSSESIDKSQYRFCRDNDVVLEWASFATNTHYPLSRASFAAGGRIYGSLYKRVSEDSTKLTRTMPNVPALSVFLLLHFFLSPGSLGRVPHARCALSIPCAVWRGKMAIDSALQRNHRNGRNYASTCCSFFPLQRRDILGRLWALTWNYGTSAEEPLTLLKHHYSSRTSEGG